MNKKIDESIGIYLVPKKKNSQRSKRESFQKHLIDNL